MTGPTIEARVRHHGTSYTRWTPLDHAIGVYDRIANLGYTRPGEVGDGLSIEIRIILGGADDRK